MKPTQTPRRDLALLAIAVALMLAGAVTLVVGWLGAAVAIALITIGIALVVVARSDVQHHHARHAPGR
jgi:hypothetical protein